AGWSTTCCCWPARTTPAPGRCRCRPSRWSWASCSARWPRGTPPSGTGPLPTTGDRDALARVVANLLDNAVRHADKGVVLSAAADGGYQRISVCDDGPGIPAADRERV